MTLFEDGPDNLPKMTKPVQLINIEKLTNEQLSAMTKQEKLERIQESAYALAENFKSEIGGDYEKCIQVVSIFLKTTGSSVNNDFGALMVAESDLSACEACRNVFPESDPVEY